MGPYPRIPHTPVLSFAAPNPHDKGTREREGG